MDRELYLALVEALAERLAGTPAFEEVFGTDDPDFTLDTLSDEDLRWIYAEYIAEE